MLGILVKRASSVGSVNRLSRKSTFSSDNSRSIPARDESRFDRRFRVVIAGKGLRTSECKLSIMQLDKLSARRFVSEARLSGISVNRFKDRSRDKSVPDSGARLCAVIEVSPLSLKLRWRKKRHFDAGRMPRVSRFDVLVFGVLEWMLDPELPDSRLNLALLGRDDV